MTEFTLQKRAAPAGPAQTTAGPITAPGPARGLAAKAAGLDQSPAVAALQAFSQALASDAVPGGGVVQGMWRAATSVGRQAARTMVNRNVGRPMAALAHPPVVVPPVLEEERGPPRPPALYRGDDSPFHTAQPGFGTHKSALDVDEILTPAKEGGDTSLALHVHGKPEDKAKSPYTSGTPNSDVVADYGDHMLEMFPSEGQRHGQAEIQADIAREKSEKLKAPAINRDGSVWKPGTSRHKAAATGLGFGAGDPLTFGDRARINSAADEESLIDGPTPAKLWKFVNADPARKKRDEGDKGHGRFGVGKNAAGKEKINLAEVAKSQGRDPRTWHPEGHRIPVDDYGREYLARQAHYASRQEEVENETAHDLEIKAALGDDAEVARLELRGPKPSGYAPQVRTGRGGATPGREAQYERRQTRMRKKVAE